MPQTARDLITSLRSTTCPACGNVKGSGKTFCAKDYFSLSNQQRMALYDRIGQGYEEAFDKAMEALGRTQIVLPTS